MTTITAKRIDGIKVTGEVDTYQYHDSTGSHTAANGVVIYIYVGNARAIYTFDYAGGTSPVANEWAELMVEGTDHILSVLSDQGRVTYAIKCDEVLMFSCSEHGTTADIKIEMSHCLPALTKIVAELRSIEAALAA